MEGADPSRSGLDRLRLPPQKLVLHLLRRVGASHADVSQRYTFWRTSMIGTNRPRPTLPGSKRCETHGTIEGAAPRVCAAGQSPTTRPAPPARSHPASSSVPPVSARRGGQVVAPRQHRADEGARRKWRRLGGKGSAAAPSLRRSRSSGGWRAQHKVNRSQHEQGENGVVARVEEVLVRVGDCGVLLVRLQEAVSGGVLSSRVTGMVPPIRRATLPCRRARPRGRAR